jgi:hypothetical protein
MKVSPTKQSGEAVFRLDRAGEPWLKATTSETFVQEALVRLFSDKTAN